MKTIKYIFISLLAAVMLSGCAKHDFFDDSLITGKVGPQAFWEVGAVVRAGTGMPFRVQYYHSEDRDISHLEVWYNLIRIEERDFFSPAVTRFAVRSLIETEVRISQRISTHSHSLAVWNDSIRAFRLDAEFPVSNTLNPFDWVHPNEFDSVMMETHFGDIDRFGKPVIEWFKDSLRNLMVWNDYRLMFVTEMTRFTAAQFRNQFTDSSQAENTGTRWIHHFPGDSIHPVTGSLVGRPVVPAELARIFDSIPAPNLILRRDGSYEVTFRRDFRINARVRIYDDRGVFGLTEMRTLDIN